MKQKIFMLLTAVLVSSVSVFAQSGNIVKLKGDVNGDGKVDVADIANVIDIMAGGEPGYFYFGTTKPTTENYKSLPGVVGDYTSIAEASGATANVAAGETLYMLCPASWTNGEGVEMEDENGNSFNFIEDFDAVTISGYVIYKTHILNDAAMITLKTTTYYLYVGTTKPTSLSQAQIVDSYPAELTYTNNSGAKAKIYVLTNNDKTVTFIEPFFNVELDQDDVDTTTITGYKIFATYSKLQPTSSLKIRIS